MRENLLRIPQDHARVMSDVDVLGPRVLNRILGDIYSSSIITVDNHGILRESIVT